MKEFSVEECLTDCLIGRLWRAFNKLTCTATLKLDPGLLVEGAPVAAEPHKAACGKCHLNARQTALARASFLQSSDPRDVG